MTTLAWVYIGTCAFSLLPGSAFKRKPEIDWAGPHAYVAVARGFGALAAAVWIVAT